MKKGEGERKRKTAIKILDWSPETCDCHIKYQFDDSLPDNEIVLSVSFIGHACDAHKDLLPNAPVTYTTVLDEGRKKSLTLDLALQNATNKLGDSFTEEGGTYVLLKPSIAFVATFEGVAPNRTLSVQFIGAALTSQEKSKIQLALNNKFGAGVITLL